MAAAESKYKFYLVLYSSLLFLLLVGLRSVVYYRTYPGHFVGNYRTLAYLEDDTLGYVPIKDTAIRSIKLNGRDTVYNATYHTDIDAHRKSTCYANKQPEEHVLFFGCSYIYGEGLNDTATLPYMVDCMSRCHKSYNLAYSGYGPQQMLAMVRGSLAARGVYEQQGVAIYTLLPEHIYRATGAMFVHNNWGSNMPYYSLDKDSLILNGTFTDGRPWTAFGYRLLNLTGIDCFIKPPKVKQADIDLTVKIITESKRLYLEAYPTSQFYVLLYPISNMQAESDALKQALVVNGVNVLDYRGLFNIDAQHTIKGDGHPNALANHLLAKQLYQDLELY